MSAFARASLRSIGGFRASVGAQHRLDTLATLGDVPAAALVGDRAVQRQHVAPAGEEAHLPLEVGGRHEGARQCGARGDGANRVVSEDDRPFSHARAAF